MRTSNSYPRLTTHTDQLLQNLMGRCSREFSDLGRQKGDVRQKQQESADAFSLLARARCRLNGGPCICALHDLNEYQTSALRNVLVEMTHTPQIRGYLKKVAPMTLEKAEAALRIC